MSAFIYRTETKLKGQKGDKKPVTLITTKLTQGGSNPLIIVVDKEKFLVIPTQLVSSPIINFRNIIIKGKAYQLMETCNTFYMMSTGPTMTMSSRKMLEYYRKQI